MILILAGILALAADSEANQPGLRSLPSCSLTSLDGQRSFDLQQLRGAPLWVDFWASWCDSCAASFAFLDGLERDFRAQGLKVLAINLDEDREAAEEFLARHPVGFQLALDAGGGCPRSFGVAGMPAAYLIDREGRIQHEHVGFRPGDASRLRRLVAELLAPEPAEAAEPGPGPGE
jgi:thiol-disulfide isomerase/thioredoxin